MRKWTKILYKTALRLRFCGIIYGMNSDALSAGTPNARDLTREIERETNLAIEAQDVAEHRELERAQALNLGRQAVGTDSSKDIDLGNKILTYNPEQVARAEQARMQGDETIRAIAEAENSTQSQAEMSPFDESKTQISEREAWDEENLRNEDNPNRDREAQLTAHDQKGIAQGMVNLVAKATEKSDFNIQNLEKTRWKGCNWMWENFENPVRLENLN